MSDEQQPIDSSEQPAPPAASGHDPNEGGGEDELRQVKLDKLAALRAAGLDPYVQVRYDRSHDAADVVARFDELEGQSVSVAGRIMARRVHGKAGFADLQDQSDRVQLYFKKDILGEESFERYASLDLGDILGASGTVFKTRTGQVSIEVREWTLLVKTLQALPEKFHGLTDVEQRYRQRYIDLIMNREVMERMTQRSRAVSAIRRFLDDKRFLEVETPMLHAIAGGATAEPFVTHWNVLKADYYLRIAIELHLKRLIVGGFERVYEIGRVFRNEGVSTRHNPEFTMLELYWAYVDYEDIMQLTEDLVVHLADTVFMSRQVQYGEHLLDLTPPFRRLRFGDALKQYADVELSELGTLEQVRAAGERIGVRIGLDKGYEQSLDEIFKEKVEPNLIQPTFIYDYPKGLSPLAKSRPENPELCFRFELFMATMELANSFSELNDPLDQRQRFESQIKDRLTRLHQVSPEMLIRPDSFSPQNAETVRGRINTALVELSKLLVANLNNSLVRPEIRASIDVAAIPELLYQAYSARNVEYETPVLETIQSLRPLLETICGQHEKWTELGAIREALDDTRLDIRLDEDFLTALEFGMPPTGGLGIGIDRLMMVLSGTEAIREVILFPQLRQH